MRTLKWKAGALALALSGATAAAAQITSGHSVGADVGGSVAPPECAGLSGPALADCLRAYETLNGGASAGAYGGGTVSGAYGTPAQARAGGAASSATTPGNATTLSIDTRNTGVDLGLTRAPDGTPVPKTTSTSAAPGSSTRRPALDNAGAASAGAPSSGGANANLLGGTNDVNAYAKPGTSALGNPTSAGRVNGNSGTDNGGSMPGLSGGTGMVNSGTPGNGLTAAQGTATGTDAATAAQAASTSRTMSGNPVAGRILGGAATGASR